MWWNLHIFFASVLGKTTRRWPWSWRAQVYQVSQQWQVKGKHLALRSDRFSVAPYVGNGEAITEQQPSRSPGRTRKFHRLLRNSISSRIFLVDSHGWSIRSHWSNRLGGDLPLKKNGQSIHGDVRVAKGRETTCPLETRVCLPCDIQMEIPHLKWRVCTIWNHINWGYLIISPLTYTSHRLLWFFFGCLFGRYLRLRYHGHGQCLPFPEGKPQELLRGKLTLYQPEKMVGFHYEIFRS